MKIYCPNSGTPTNYTNKKPNFCSNCGYSHIKGEMSAEEEIGHQEIETAHNAPAGNLNSLSVEIQANEYRGVEIQNVVQQAGTKGQRPDKKTRQAPPDGLKQGDIQEQFKKEAGSLKEKN